MRVALRPRSFVRVAGPGAEEYLDRMLSNDVAALGPGESCEALLLTAKARVIAPLVVLRRGHEDFLLLTEPELGERVRAELLRSRFAAKAEIEPEEHTSHVVFGGRGDPDRRLRRAGRGGARRGARRRPSRADELELLRIQAGTPAWGKEIDDRVLPAEAGLTERAVSFTKGCYPGQEPIARLHYRGHANRGLRVLTLAELPAPDAELSYEGKSRRPDHERRSERRRRRRARLRAARGARGRGANGRRARRYTDRSPAPVAQGIERCPAEAEVASSNRAGRMLAPARPGARTRRSRPRSRPPPPSRA